MSRIAWTAFQSCGIGEKAPLGYVSSPLYGYDTHMDFWCIYIPRLIILYFQGQSLSKGRFLEPPLYGIPQIAIVHDLSADSFDLNNSSQLSSTFW